ncbi:MAG: ribbon-helix-helix domain-containing protein [Leptospirales bacterium]|nr:ribbon-helix-helix domain-containing protein [Leptospirales bacterium]
MITVRLPAEIKQRLELLAKSKNKSKSDIIKEALMLFMFKEESKKDSYELGKEYFGKYGSGDGTLSTSYKKKVKEKIDAKKSIN